MQNDRSKRKSLKGILRVLVSRAKHLCNFFRGFYYVVRKSEVFYLVVSFSLNLSLKLTQVLNFALPRKNSSFIKRVAHIYRPRLFL